MYADSISMSYHSFIQQTYNMGKHPRTSFSVNDILSPNAEESLRQSASSYNTANMASLSGSGNQSPVTNVMDYPRNGHFLHPSNVGDDPCREIPGAPLTNVTKLKRTGADHRSIETASISSGFSSRTGLRNGYMVETYPDVDNSGVIQGSPVWYATMAPRCGVSSTDRRTSK